MNSNVKSLFSSMFRELHKSREYGGQIIANQGVFFGHLQRHKKRNKVRPLFLFHPLSDCLATLSLFNKPDMQVIKILACFLVFLNIKLLQPLYQFLL